MHSGGHGRVLFFFCSRFSDDRRDQDDRDDKADEELKPLTREELKKRAIDHVKTLEKRALQEQNKYNDVVPVAARQRSSTGLARTGGGGEPGRATNNRGR